MTATSLKNTLRAQARANRASLAAEQSGFAQAIAVFADALAIPPGAVVAGYWPVRDEADPRALMAALAARGHALALPCLQARDGALLFRRWQAGDELVSTHFGLSQPLPFQPELRPKAVLVPLLAFDPRGHRLGYGGGFYDRTLDELRARGEIFAIGVAYAGQELPALPDEGHDHLLDAIVTELGVRAFG